MKKNYVCPQIDIIYTKMEDALLAGSDGTGKLPRGPHGPGAKAYDVSIDDFSEKALWSDEIDENNK